MTSRRWCFTINNPEAEDFPTEWEHEKIKLCIYQGEIGDEGTFHLQGYLETLDPCRMASLKKMNGKAHWERAMGTREQGILYCLKEESSLGMKWWLYQGSWQSFEKELPDSLTTIMNAASMKKKQSSTVLRLSKIRERLCDGNSDSIMDIADNEFDLWVRYYRAFEKYSMMKTKPRDHPVDVHVLQGPTGTGKSKWALETYKGAYWKQRSNWWDGYMGHDVVIIDEFYGWMPFDLLLRICDRYPLMVETKGGQVQFVAKTIIITTNQLPSSWYKSCYFPALRRRISHWHVLPIWGFHSVYKEYGDFVKHASENIITP